MNGSAAQLVSFTRQPCRAIGLVPSTRQVVERTGSRANGPELILNIERTLGLQSLRTTNVMIKATKYFRSEWKGTPRDYFVRLGPHQVDSLLGPVDRLIHVLLSRTQLFFSPLTTQNICPHPLILHLNELLSSQLPKNHGDAPIRFAPNNCDFPPDLSA